jgi:hypothetical protein
MGPKIIPARGHLPGKGALWGLWDFNRFGGLTTSEHRDFCRCRPSSTASTLRTKRLRTYYDLNARSCQKTHHSQIKFQLLHFPVNSLCFV